MPPFTFSDELAFRFDFAARPNMPPVSVYWYHHANGDAYTPPGMTAEQARKIPGTGPQVGPPQGQGGGAAAAPSGTAGMAGGAAGTLGGASGGGPGQQGSGYNCIFVGTKGYMGTSGRGEGVGLLPASRWADYKLPNAYLTRSPGASTGSNHPAHIRDWVRGCKGGAVPCSNFSIAGPYNTEWMILAAAAVHAGGKLIWNYQKGEFTHNDDVNK